MNLVYIHTHDSGRYLEPYGHRMDTPAIMEFAKQSTLFRHAYCAAPTCSPSRAALLTGMLPHSCGMIGLAHRGFSLNDSGKHLANFLHQNGFETTLCGIQHESKNPSSLGYEKILSVSPPKSLIEMDEQNAERACAYLQQKKATKEKPFFLSFGMFHTHRVYPDCKQYGNVNPDRVLPPPTVPDTAENRYDMACYITAMQMVDRCVGRVMTTLQETGLDENTLVIFTTDHGIAFPFMKCNLYDTGIGVSLMIRYPNNPMAGRATDCMVSHMDIYPTICEMLHLKKPDWLQGVSLLPVLTQNTPVRTEIFAEVTYHAAYEPQRCIRTQQYKFIRRFDTHLKVVPANIDLSPSKKALLQNGYLEQPLYREELYDLVLDPYERINRVNDSRYAAIYTELSEKLIHHMQETNDPLFQHPEGVPCPKGAFANAITDIDPE